MIFFGTRNQWRMALGLVVGSAVAAGLSARAGAHGGYRVFPIAELTDEMLEQIQLDDGSVEEWFDLVDEPTMSLVDFRWYGHIPDPSDLDFRIWLAWHDEPDRLYVAFTASDDAHIIYDEATEYYLGDPELILAIDGDHSGGGSGLESWEAGDFWGNAQQYGAIARTADSRTALFGHVKSGLSGGYTTTNRYDSWMFFPPYGDAGGDVIWGNPIIRVIELYVTPYDGWQGIDSRPEDVVVSDLTAGEVIGFAILVGERDDEYSRGTLTPEAVQTEDPELDILSHYRADVYLDGLLLPANAARPVEDSAVESVSWGRIKASLEFE